MVFGVFAAVGDLVCRVAMLVCAVLFAGCDHEALMLGRWSSKRRHFATERVECCDHGLYIVCVVAGLIFDIFLPRNGRRKKASRRK